MSYRDLEDRISVLESENERLRAELSAAEGQCAAVYAREATANALLDDFEAA